MVADTVDKNLVSLPSYSTTGPSNYNRNYWPSAEFVLSPKESEDSASSSSSPLPEPINTKPGSGAFLAGQTPWPTADFETEYLPVLWSMLFGTEQPSSVDNAPIVPPLMPPVHTLQRQEGPGGKLCTSPSSVALPIRRHHQQSVDLRSQKLNVCGHRSCDKITQLGTYCTKHGGRRICSVEGCKRVDRGRGLCGSHGGGKRCKVLGCEKASRKHGLCSAHFRQSNQNQLM